MKATVVIPVKNPGLVFKKVLESVLDQEVPYPYDILIIDSGSTDGTLEYIQELQPRCAGKVNLHQINPSEFGHRKSRNLAISMSSAPYVAMITHDACPASKQWLAELVDVAESDQSIAGVFGRHLAYPHASIFTKHELTVHFHGFEAQPIVFLEDEQRYKTDEGYRQYLHFFSDNNSLIRRSVWEKIPYPDVDFAEDQIWARQIIEAGFKKGYAHDAVVYHSHDYALFERLQRSFDESYAFVRLFGYRLCPTVGAMVRSWLAITHRDLRYSLIGGRWRRHLGDVVRMPFDNAMRLVGHFLGTHGDSVPPWLRLKISRDRRLLAGLLKSR